MTKIQNSEESYIKNIFESMKVGAVTASFCIEGIAIDGLLKINDKEFTRRLEWMNTNHTS